MMHPRRFTPEDRLTVLRRALVTVGTLIEDERIPLPVDPDTLDDETTLALIAALSRRLSARGYGAPSAS